MSDAALVVDDDPTWQELLAEILADAGLEVEVAAGVPAALAALHERPHRIAVVDLSLGRGARPDQEGLEVLEAVRRLDPGCVPVLLTGYATVELAVSALTQYGALTVLQKDTFRRARFREVLRQALSVAPVLSEAQAPAPLAAAGPGEAPAEAAPAGQPGAEGEPVLLVEDDAGWRSILAQILAEAGFRVQACRSFGEALGHLRRESYRLAVVDLALASSLDAHDNRDGWQLLDRVRAAGIRSIVVSGSAAPADAERAYAEHGIFAYLEKAAFDRRAFLAAVRAALDPGQAAPDDLAALTRRELDVLALVAQGLTNKEIARALVVSPNTVKRYLKSIFEKLDVDTRAAAAGRAIRAGLGGRA